MNRTLSRLSVVLVIFCPFIGLELSRLYFEILKGEWWYFISSERSLMLSFGILLSILYFLKFENIKKIYLNYYDLLIIFYAWLFFVSIIISIFNEGVDVILIKQVFIFFVMFFSYRIGRSSNLFLDKEILMYGALFIVTINVALSVLGAYPGSSSILMSLLILLCVICYEKSLCYFVFLSLFLIMFVMGLEDINRTFMAWFFVYLLVNLYFYYKKAFLFILCPLVIFLVIVFGALFDFSKGISVDDESSKTLGRISSIVFIIGGGDLEEKVSLNDREYENNSVKQKFDDEAGFLNYVFGFGATARYDVALSRKVIYENHNVHVGFYSELLKRGVVGVFVLIMINLFVIYRGVLDKDYLYRKDRVEYYLFFWFYVLSLIYWFTWSAMFFTYMLNWIYIGMKLSNYSKASGKRIYKFKWR
ncbi:hypothetical protein Q4508_14090 [Amphritea sp. 2_MG-2023]|uniref:hypothetical protein n=1 Tax=Amphritea TaxID=515417 RepID=UPI001C0702E9|nr:MULTISPECIES: hypothetical protein [Amphritea]MBU2964355.1 hypothetical protein [Amphritea atlantica]MDO6419685.1 hypothetical protein [Amphritea sp. 2_MG-2023]